MSRIILTLAAIVMAGCVTSPSPQHAFFGSLTRLCGQSYAGKVVSDDPQDADWSKEELVIHVRDCEADLVRIPLHVGENRSRTWAIQRSKNTLTLEHHHRHKDGTSDAVTLYGGTTNSPGTTIRQEFPASDYSKSLFEREGLAASKNNIWAMEIHEGKMFAYELSREGRFFRAEFDLANPIATPPPAWGSQ